MKLIYRPGGFVKVKARVLGPFLFLSSCTVASKHNSPPPTPKPVTAEAAAPVNSVADLKPPPAPAAELAPVEKPLSEQIHENMTISLKRNGKTVVADEAPAPAAPAPLPAPVAAPDSSRKVGAVPFTQALGWLKNGNTRFVKNHLRKDGQSMADVKRLTGGQKPHSIVLSCSDSRVPPEIVFDQKLGEIFVVRVLGEVLDASTISSIEYAVEHLGTNYILVMGHTQCGAMKAAFATLKGGSAGSEALDHLVADIHPRLQSYKDAAAPTAGYLKESWSNVKGVAQNLVERSPLVRAAVQSGSLKVGEAMYDMDTGVVTFW